MAPPILKRWTTDPEYINFFNFLIEKTENVKSPMNIQPLAIEFKEKSGAPQTEQCLHMRIERMRTHIHSFQHIDTDTKVKLLFALSASVDASFLKKLKKDAFVEVDKKKRITHYQANDRSLELNGDHSFSAKQKTAQLGVESKRNIRPMINNYFKNKNNADAVPKNEKEKEMGNLIEFITEKCENVDSPLNILQLARDFNQHSGVVRDATTIGYRIRKYRCEIQKAEFLDTQTKIRQLFGLSVKLDSDFLRELRKIAVVEVDHKNRIIKYTANDGSLTLRGSHHGSGGINLILFEKKDKKSVTATADDSGEESDIAGFDDSSDEYSSEEFDSEFSSDEENDHLDETADLTQPSNGADDLDNEISVRNRSEISIDDNFDFNCLTESSHKSEEIEMRENEETEKDLEISENASVKTRSGRLSKRRHLDSEFSYNLANSGSSRTSLCTNSTFSKPAKQKKKVIEKEQASSSSNESRSSSGRSSRNSSFPSISRAPGENIENQEALEVEGVSSDCHGPNFQEMEDYDYNPREDNHLESTPIDNRLQEQEPPAVEEPNLNNEAQSTDNKADEVAPEPKPEKETLTLQNKQNTTPQTNEKEVISTEIPIKVEQEEPIKIENYTEDVKPEISHNFKIKFFNAMKSLILFLDTPSLSDLKSETQQKIRKMRKSNGVLQNNVLFPALELLVARMINHSVVNLSENVCSVGLIQFLCYLKASILNSKLIGVEGLVKYISKLIEESQNKRIPMEHVANALRATLDTDGF